jgi:hypothetical protein
MRQEEGLTIVEVVVAGLILVAGALGVLGIIDSATRNTFRAEQSQVVANVLQGEMEKLRQIPYAELALTKLPADSGDANDPNSRMASTSFYYTGRNETGLKPLVYNGSANGKDTIEEGTVDPGPTPFQVGDIQGTVSRFVVWDTCPSALCQDKRHLKRVVVAVRLDGTASGGQNRSYQEVQGQFVDPQVEPQTFPNQEPGGSDTIPWTLFLTDTPCSESEWHQPAGGHSTHNTRGDCADGLSEENTPGAPDLLWPDGWDEEGEEEIKDPGFDYSVEIEPQPAEDEGLQVLPGGACSTMTPLATGAATAPDADPDTFRKVHRWLSPPVPDGESPDDVLLTGEGTLTLWTRTINSAVYGGRVCAWLFVRSYDETTVTDTVAINLGPPLSLHFNHFASAWPSSGWTEVSIPLSFGYAEEGGALPVEPGSRLGLGLSVDESTPTGLQFIYDSPSFDSKLHLETTGAAPPGI